MIEITWKQNRNKKHIIHEEVEVNDDNNFN